MESPEEKPRPRMRWPFYVALFVVLVPVVYLLSVGPANRLWEKGYLSYGTLGAIYAPVRWMTDRFPEARRMLEWYVELWSSWLPD